ncbi:MAG: beta-agarase [Coraliomargaritaceae bacterium]
MLLKNKTLTLLSLLSIPAGFLWAHSTREAGDTETAEIHIFPELTRAIGGVSELDRKRYFSVSDHGTGFDKRMPDEIYDYLVNDLGITFGRQLGPVKWTASRLPEDPNRPGYADVSSLKNQKLSQPGEQFMLDFGPNLDVAAHGNHNAYPAYMGKYQLEGAKYRDKAEWVPENIDAAVELAAAVFEYNYNDFDRPKYFEPLNEPHWLYFKDQHFADWHMAIHKRFKEDFPEVEVGGMCQSVSYFYRENYQNFSGMQGFYDATDGQMDFYSFHSYDYFKWEDGDIRGRVQSGLPLEGNLDLLQNYAVLQHGKEVDVVVSEQGGYISVQPRGEYDGEPVASLIAEKYFPEDTWENELKKRSVVSFVHISSIIANTLAFIDHPHTVKKSVPFLLPNTWAWDPKYYAGLFVPENYTDKSKWVPSPMLDFYKLFRDVEGRRVVAHSSDPDLQTRAFVDGSKLYLVINNQSWRPESLRLYGLPSRKVEMRRYGRNDDFTAYYKESKKRLSKRAMEIAGRETVVFVVDTKSIIQEENVLNEISCYGDQTRVLLSEKPSIHVAVPTDQEIEYAYLRIGLTRVPGLNKQPVVLLNGKELDVPLEDCADRFDISEYGTTKIIPVDPYDLKAMNRVEVSFPDGDDGAIGSVVLRVAVQ